MCPLPALFALTVSLGLMALAPQAHAEDAATQVQPAYAAAYAPEAAFESCRAGTASKAVECALKACADASGYPEDCYILAACEGGGWAGVMGVMVTEVHFTTVTCGAPSREALLAELKARCAGHLPYMQECWVAELIPLHEAETEAVEISWTAESVVQP
ncbi:MAG: hypothetical protein ACFB0Z_08975 [Candidatus Phaeomarinobacter sp.]